MTPSRTEQRALVVLLAGVAGFQAALAGGAPLGAAAWGGRHPGVLPRELRLASAAACVAWGTAAGLVATGQPGSAPGRVRLLRGIAVTATAGTLANLASPSTPERVVWAPVSAAVAALAWRAGRRERLTA
ncbi:MAG TPA: hypothetical protein VF140_09355 [Phycicoccus sp.]